MNIIYLDTVESTNDTAKKMAHDGCPDWTVVQAGAQTKGKGRMGRSWFSPSGDGLFFSVILRPKEINSLSAATLVTALAVCRTLRKMNIEVGIKWPNDILLNGKKIGGILLETSLQENRVEYLVIGIGINFKTEIFYDELSDKATSLFLETGQVFEQNLVLHAVLEELLLIWNFFNSEGFAPLTEEYKAYCVHMNKEVFIIQGNKAQAGVCVDISEGGELVIRFTDGNIKNINAGEVSLRGISGYLP